MKEVDCCILSQQQEENRCASAAVALTSLNASLRAQVKRFPKPCCPRSSSTFPNYPSTSHSPFPFLFCHPRHIPNLLSRAFQNIMPHLLSPPSNSTNPPSPTPTLPSPSISPTFFRRTSASNYPARRSPSNCRYLRLNTEHAFALSFSQPVSFSELFVKRLPAMRACAVIIT